METQRFGVLIVPVAATQILLAPFKKPKSTVFVSVAALIVPVLLLALPWYLKSFAHTGVTSILNVCALRNFSGDSAMATFASSPTGHGILNVLQYIGNAQWSFSLFGHIHRVNGLGLLPFAIMPAVLFVKVPVKIRYIFLYAILFLAQLVAVGLWIIPGGSVFCNCLFLLLIVSPLVVWLISHLSGRPVLKFITTAVAAGMIFSGGVVFVKQHYRDWIALFTLAHRDAYLEPLLHPDSGLSKPSTPSEAGHNGNQRLFGLPYQHPVHSGIQDLRK
jgi:hypothetical protein